MTNEGRLAGKVALVTGAARGIGEATAARFVAEGASVVVADIDESGAALVADRQGKAAAAAHLDVGDAASWTRAVEYTTEHYGRLDVLVNNAGIGAGGPLHQAPLDQHYRVIEVNLHGVFLGMRAVADVMSAGGGGAIVNVSSIDGLVGIRGLTSYVASKHAVTGMTRSAALEFGPLGIRVNSVHPGVIATPLVTQSADAVREKLDRLVARQPIPRMGRPDEVASMVTFLASDESSYCTGAAFVVDGGHLAGPWREDYATDVAAPSDV
ncbi:glucose 1-dehydrogenase [Streptomyces sp. PSKA54]|uniref:Glucose 1-dehydrogenase n=1 Tax=Streptomyces himalayensis subsp. aureolus TaxID=2758039 RepID=A0A7W2D2U3_9ACTN|nr:glucose 1-dehydrogenase [Streptomyces himalayensis]MBA4863589.1 glucose 1-dehydrogenase [Streptomyces himalayensis subsp. aureolus]